MKKVSLVLVAIISLSLFVITPKQAFADQSADLYPVSDGTYTQWTPNTGTTHYTTVDETTCNGLTDYVTSSATVGNRESYGINISSIPDNAQINQIEISPCASKGQTGGSAVVMNVFYRLNGVNSADAGAYSMSATTPTELGRTQFSGLTTIKNAASTLEVGVVYASGTKTARLSRIKARITYFNLQPPTSLTATALGTEAAQLNWVDNTASESGYKIERSTDNVNFTQVASVAANVTSYVNTNVSGTYYYRVRAFNGTYNSLYSNTAVVSVPLGAPTSLAVVDLGTGSAKLTWVDNSVTETGFNVEKSTDNVAFVQIGSVGANVKTFTDFVTSGTYYYRVKAYKSTLESAYSNVASIIIP